MKLGKNQKAILQAYVAKRLSGASIRIGRRWCRHLNGWRGGYEVYIRTDDEDKEAGGSRLGEYDYEVCAARANEFRAEFGRMVAEAKAVNRED